MPFRRKRSNCSSSGYSRRMFFKLFLSRFFTRVSKEQFKNCRLSRKRSPEISKLMYRSMLLAMTLTSSGASNGSNVDYMMGVIPAKIMKNNWDKIIGVSFFPFDFLQYFNCKVQVLQTGAMNFPVM